jgi:hypothetical protein
VHRCLAASLRSTSGLVRSRHERAVRLRGCDARLDDDSKIGCTIIPANRGLATAR